jgi:hypothetical protein
MLLLLLFLNVRVFTPDMVSNYARRLSVCVTVRVDFHQMTHL